MSIIKILPENLINQIAAGEVVERPASCVKELLENSIDAGADKITIQVKDGGKTFIKVLDNGRGMEKIDCELALQRHATSKITTENDLWRIRTMGFRGEALASIASVSKMILRSRRKEDLAGTEIDVNGGEIVTVKETGMSPGTAVTVHNLFFNTPARQKYLKQESTEFGHITAILNTIALANPHIAFKLTHNEKIICDLPKVTDLTSRIRDVFGPTVAEAMLPIFYGGSEVQLDGYIGKPLLSRSTSQHQYFFVNGRPVQQHLLANTIKSAYHSMLMENKKPIFVINIKIDPALVDVNVHPRKLEVRFENQQLLIKTLYSATKTALEKTSLIPKAFTESRRYMADSFPNEKVRSQITVPESRKPTQSRIMEAIDFSREILVKRERTTIQNPVEPKMKSITQIANSYIVAEDENGLVLIDQHAAHERVRYEELMDQFENQNKSIQPLLVPMQIEFSSDEKILFEENRQIFVDLGFEIEPFGGNTFLIQSVPNFLAKEELEDVIKGVLDDIINNKKPSAMQGRVEEIITYMSCRSAIKFGKKLSEEEIRALIIQMEKCKRQYTCPHGRPTMISLSLSELEKMFGRK